MFITISFSRINDFTLLVDFKIQKTPTNTIDLRFKLNKRPSRNIIMVSLTNMLDRSFMFLNNEYSSLFDQAVWCTALQIFFSNIWCTVIYDHFIFFEFSKTFACHIHTKFLIAYFSFLIHLLKSKQNLYWLAFYSNALK